MVVVVGKLVVVVVGKSGEGEPQCEVVEGISGAWGIWAAAA